MEHPTQLTTKGDVYKYTLLWSPDSKKIMWADKQQRLQYVDVESKKVTLVMQSDVWEFTDYAWSPDSKWIAFAKPEEEVNDKALFVFFGNPANDRSDGWLVLVLCTDIQLGWEVSLFCFRPDIQSIVQSNRMEPCLLRYGKDIFGDAVERDKIAVRAEERRSEDEGGKIREVGRKI